MKRLFDIIFSATALILLSPILAVVSLLIVLESRGGVLFLQKRIGRNEKVFYICKFRTMVVDAEKKGRLTVGARDPRITATGVVLRKYKLDELPQFWNVLKGEMSIVGPRPELQHYVDLYNPNQKRVLSVRPGITDYASLKYFSENELLAQSSNPEETYIHQIMPEKLSLNLEYIEQQNFLTDLKIIFKTAVKIFR